MDAYRRDRGNAVINLFSKTLSCLRRDCAAGGRSDLPIVSKNITICAGTVLPALRQAASEAGAGILRRLYVPRIVPAGGGHTECGL